MDVFLFSIFSCPVRYEILVNSYTSGESAPFYLDDAGSRTVITNLAYTSYQDRIRHRDER